MWLTLLVLLCFCLSANGTRDIVCLCRVSHVCCIALCCGVLCADRCDPYTNWLLTGQNMNVCW